MSNAEPDKIRLTGASRTTSDEFEARKRRSSSQRGQSARQTAADKAADYAGLIIGTPPKRVPEIEIQVQSGKVLLPAGFHLVTGATGSGKTVTSVALTLEAKRQGIPAIYVYQWEARAVVNKDLNPDEQVCSNLPLRVRNAITAKKANSDLPEFFRAAMSHHAKTGQAALLVIDSVSLPMRLYDGGQPEARSGQATMKEGMQPMDIQFVEKMEELAVANNLAILGLVNADLVPFAARLEGITEGLIDILPGGRLTQRNRTLRKWTDATLKPESRVAAATWLGYKQFESQNESDAFGFSGLATHVGRI